MFWAIAAGAIDTRGFAFEQVLQDIQTLNEWALEARLEVTAISLHAYPFVQSRYALLPHGASIGSGYGPVVVARKPLSLDQLRETEIVIPGRMTTAYLALRLALGDVAVRELPFDRIGDEVASGRAEAGLLIHEGQLTYADEGLTKSLDLGEWWLLETGLPLPLGVNVARRDLGDRLPELSAVLLDSIRAGLEQRDEAMRYAMGFGRGIDEALADRFVAHVRERPHLRLRRRGASGRRGAAPARRGDRRVSRARQAATSSPSDGARLRSWRALARATAASSMSRAVVLSAVRTPVGRYGGGLAGVRPDDLAAIAIGAAVERAGVDPAELEDVYLGCANQAGEDNRNVARMAALLAGLPESVAGVTVNRLCASGLSAVVGACHAIVAGDGDLFVAGGVESMSRAPLVTSKPDAAFPRGDRTMYDTTLGWRFPNPALAARFPLESMGETGENVAERFGVSREEQDAFALRSQQRWAAADFADELVSVGELERDEHPRPETSAEKLASLKPAFRAEGTVTAGNSSGLNDGAAALVLASEEKAQELGIEPLGAFVASAVAGVDPRVMGIGPVPAVRKLLERTGVAVEELDLVELNEAFASQSLAVVRELGLDEEKVNVNGGAIAIGHPLGMSGARLVVTLLHELRRRGGRYGVATMCVGVGQGQAALFER